MTAQASSSSSRGPTGTRSVRFSVSFFFRGREVESHKQTKKKLGGEPRRKFALSIAVVDVDIAAAAAAFPPLTSDSQVR